MIGTDTRPGMTAAGLDTLRPGGLSIAFSPCPNDTFVFHAWAHGLLPGAPRLRVTFADIDVTNGLAERGELDVLKISFAALPWVLDRYALLPCGGALGHGCGPLVLVRGDGPSTSAGSGVPEEALAGEALSGKVVAVPSERSTAYLLFRLWAAAQVPGGIGGIRVMPFDTIMPAVRDGEVDGGLVIHEARFTYPGYGLSSLVDLGAWWEEDTGLPIPLGAIVARRELDLAELARLTRASVEAAWADPAASRTFVMEHAQEMDPAVADAHIDLYVNEFTRDLGKAGYAAVEALLTRAAAEGLVPAIDPRMLRN